MIATILIAFSGGGSEDASLLSVNWGLAFWTVLTFLLLLFILKKFAWKPILTALDEREKKIQDSLETAERSKNEAQAMIDENKKNIARAEEEAQKILREGRAFAEKLKTELVEKNKAEAEKILTEAQAEIERKKQEAFEQLKNQVADLSLQVAEKILRQNLNKESNKDLVQKYLEDLKKN